MSQTGDSGETSPTQYAFNLVLVGVAGGAGCVTILIIFIALFAGLWLDNTLQTRPVFTVILMIGSIPVTLAAMLLLVRFATSRIKPPLKTESGKTQEDV